MFLQNISKLLTEYTASHPRKWYSLCLRKICSMYIPQCAYCFWFKVRFQNFNLTHTHSCYHICITSVTITADQWLHGLQHVWSWTRLKVRIPIQSMDTGLLFSVFCCPMLVEALWWDNPLSRDSYQIFKGFIVSKLILNWKKPYTDEELHFHIQPFIQKLVNTFQESSASFKKMFLTSFCTSVTSYLSVPNPPLFERTSGLNDRKKTTSGFGSPVSAFLHHSTSMPYSQRANIRTRNQLLAH